MGGIFQSPAAHPIAAACRCPRFQRRARRSVAGDRRHGTPPPVTDGYMDFGTRGGMVKTAMAAGARAGIPRFLPALRYRETSVSKTEISRREGKQKDDAPWRQQRG